VVRRSLKICSELCPQRYRCGFVKALPAMYRDRAGLGGDPALTGGFVEASIGKRATQSTAMYLRCNSRTSMKRAVDPGVLERCGMCLRRYTATSLKL
jgi:hypothetical protein